MRVLGISFIFCVALLGCGKEESIISAPEKPVTVGFWIKDLPQSRTVIDDSGLSTLWSKDDVIALWASNLYGNGGGIQLIISILISILGMPPLQKPVLPPRLQQLWRLVNILIMPLIPYLSL